MMLEGTTVVKLGGRTQGDPALPAALAALWRASGGRLVVVHGGGDAVSELQRARGLEPRFVGGRRVTGAGDIEIIRMALSGLANKQLVSAMTAAGVPALGLSGEDGALLVAERVRDAELGQVGTPSRVNVALLATLVGAGTCPVVSPVSASATVAGEALNVNGDDAAAAIAGAIAAHELYFMADVEGVMARGVVVPELDEAGAALLVRDGVVTGGMGAKLEAARAALGAGVGRVRIGGLAALADPALGTTIVPPSAR